MSILLAYYQNDAKLGSFESRNVNISSVFFSFEYLPTRLCISEGHNRVHSLRIIYIEEWSICIFKNQGKIPV